ncbi:MAG: helix-turn-helix transcriptional regulator [Opitutaceae bacterium]|nr:helix-turn-helix transcriptional regulator [Opitutaceae bacterium]
MPRVRRNEFAYLPLAGADIRRELYVTGWGVADYDPGETYPHPGHPEDYDFHWERGRVLGDFAVVLISRGEGEYEDRRLGRLPWRAGEVLLLPPGQWHRYRPGRGTGWAEAWCTINGEYLHRLRAKGIFPRSACLRRLGDPAACQRALTRLRATAERNSLLVESRVFEVLAHALEDRATNDDPAGPAATGQPSVDQALEFIWLNCHRPIDAAAVARETGTALRTLERHFSTAHERSPSAEIRWCRTQRAIVMLRESRMSVKEVGYACGFGGAKGLTRALRTLHARSPSDYRSTD